jgi:xanthine dehydrogenase accessory factor
MLGESHPWRSRVVSYGISDEMAADVGLSCGGEIEVLIRGHEPGDPVWSDLLDLLDQAASSSGHRAYGALVTGLSEEILGRQVLVRADGSKTGSLGDPSLDGEVARERDRLFSHEGAEALPLDSGHRVFVERVLPPRHLVIIGATPIAVSLSALASRVGYHVTIVDPRDGLARPSLFPDADVLQSWPDEALSELNVAEWTDVAVLAHSERLDLPALRGAIEAGCRYVGLLGGKRTQAARREALEAAGVPASSVSRIRGPIGLDIGAVSPQEIAVAILAEVLAVRLAKAER